MGVSAWIKNKLLTVGGKTVVTDFIIPPGMHISSAYAAGDAVGTPFVVDVPRSGDINTVLVQDLDSEQLQLDIVLFSSLPTRTADDSPFDMADEDGPKYVGHITVTAADYIAFADNAVAVVTKIGLSYVAPERKLYGQVVTRGAPNLTSLQDYRIRFVISSDE